MSPSFKQVFFLSLLVILAPLADGQTQTKISEEQVLSWTLAGMPKEHELSYLRSRGLEDCSESLLSAVTAAGGNDEVIAYLRKADAATKEPSSPAFAALVRAARAMQRNDLEASYKDIHDASEVDPKNVNLHFAVAGVLKKAEIWGEAAKEYRIVIQLAPQFLDGWQGLSYAYYRAGDAARSASFAREAIKLDANDSDSYKFLGLALEQMDDKDGSLKAYAEALRLNPKNAAVYYDRAILEYGAEKTDDAIADGRKAIELNPNEPSYWYNLGLNYDKKDDFESAINAYKQAKRLNPQALEVRQNLGADYCASQQHAAAITEFRELLKIDPRWNMARPCLAKSLAATNDFKGAIEVGEQFLRYEPQDEPMLRSMCRWYWALGRAADSEPLYDRLVIIAQQQHGHDSHDYGMALTQRGALLASEKKYPEADKDFKEGIRIMRAAGSDYQPMVDAMQKQYDEMLAHWHGTSVSTGAVVPTAHSSKSPAAMTAGDSALQNWQSQLQAANTAMNQRNYAKAASLFDKAVEAAAKIEPANEQVAQTLQQYSGLYMRQRDFPKAEELMLRALDVTRKNMGVGSQFEATSLDALGNLFLFESKYDDAVQTFTQALALHKKWLGPRDPGLGMALDHLAGAYSSAGKLEQAQPLLDQYLKITEDYYGPDDFNVSVPLDHLGALYIREKQYDKAEVMYRRALAVDEKKFGANSPMLNGPLYSLSDCLRQLGRPAEARAFDERREALMKR